VYGTDEKRFTVFIQKSDVTAEQALAWGWHLNWVAMPESNDNGGFCTGKTAAQNTDWQQLGRNGLTTQLGTDCQAPLVFATLGGRHSHWYTRGVSSIYGVDGPNFRLQVNRYAVTPQFARDNNWHIHWTRATPTLR
jgi:hypothetical protein